MSHASTPGQPVVEVRRSKRRKRTVSAYERDGVIVVMIPHRSTKAQEARYVADLVAKLQRKAHLERQVSLAARAFHDVIEERFTAWSLTAAERDVAHFTVKGLSITDIAGLRGSAEGTVKSQLNAIYRKAGVGNRGEFLSLLIEDLVDSRDLQAPEKTG